MRHVVVLQFDEESIDGIDHLVALEDELVACVGPIGEVDGHDMGAGEANIFIYTDTPELVFSEARRVLEREQLLSVVRVAYRAFDGESYTILWPTVSNVPFRVA